MAKEISNRESGIHGAKVHIAEPREWSVWWRGELTLQEKRLATVACDADSPRAFLRAAELYRDLEWADREERIDMLFGWLADGGEWVPPKIQLDALGRERSRNQDGRERAHGSRVVAVSLARGFCPDAGPVSQPEG